MSSPNFQERLLSLLEDYLSTAAIAIPDNTQPNFDERLLSLVAAASAGASARPSGFSVEPLNATTSCNNNATAPLTWRSLTGPEMGTPYPGYINDGRSDITLDTTSSFRSRDGGIYLVHGQLAWEANATGYRAVYSQDPGSGQFYEDYKPSPGAFDFYQPISFVTRIEPQQSFGLRIKQNSGGALTVKREASGITGTGRSYLQVIKLAPFPYAYF